MILADTHIVAWLAAGVRKSPLTAQDRLFDQGFSISAVTAWEYQDLRQRGRLPAAASLESILKEFDSLVVDFPADTWKIANQLPPVHGDPVDRMLVAHALIAGATLASADRHVRSYPVQLLW